jgi:hypothetical protein
MKRALLGLLVGCSTLVLASVAFAGANADAGISLHITNPPVKATLCDLNAPSFGGRGGKNIDTNAKPCFQGQTGDFDVWVLVCNASDSVGIAGVEFGLEYDGATGSGVDVLDWAACGDLEFTSGSFPASGGGNAVTWLQSNCQFTNTEFHGTGKNDDGENNGKQVVPNSVIAVAGVLRVTVFGSDVMEIIPRPVSGTLKVANCAAVEENLTNAVVPRGGSAGFCSDFNGYNFCQKGALPAGQTTTWGNIKTLYRQ